MSRLTILIPSRDVHDCEDLLVSVLQNRLPSTDVIVVHSSPYNDPYSLASEIRFIEATGKTSRTQLLNVGLQAARSEFVHLLGPQMRVTEGWTDVALSWFDQREIAAVSPLCTRAADQDHMTAGVTYQLGGHRGLVQGSYSQCLSLCHKHVLGPTLSAGFYRRSALLELGGFATEVGDDLADVDMALSLQEAGWQSVVDPRCRVLDMGAAETSESSLSQSWYAERLFWRHARSYGWPMSLVCHPWEVTRSLLSAAPTGLQQLFGRAMACLELGTMARHVRQIADARYAREAAEPEPTLLSFPQRTPSVRTMTRRAA